MHVGVFCPWVENMRSLITAIFCFTCLAGLAQNVAPARPLNKPGAVGKAGIVYTFKADLSAEQRQQMLGEIREKLWQQWQQRQPAQIQVVDHGPGHESRTWYMFEQDSDGLWRMTIKTKSTASDPWYPTVTYQENIESQVYSIDRVLRPRSSSAKPAQQAADGKLLADSYQLVFKNKFGGQVQYF